MCYAVSCIVINKHAPLKTKEIKLSNCPEWLTYEIKEVQKHMKLYHKGELDKFLFWRNKSKTLKEKSEISEVFPKYDRGKQEPREI